MLHTLSPSASGPEGLRSNEMFASLGPQKPRDARITSLAQMTLRYRSLDVSRRFKDFHLVLAQTRRIKEQS